MFTNFQGNLLRTSILYVACFFLNLGSYSLKFAQEIDKNADLFVLYFIGEL